MRYHLTPVRIATGQGITNVGEDAEKKKNPHTLLVGLQIGTATMKKVWKFLKKLRIDLPCDPVIPPLGIYPKDLKICI